MRLDKNLAAALLLLVVALLIQVRIGVGVHASDLAGMDDPAHYTTGVMVYDYLRHAVGSSPMQFALSFYQRFPKVALGHWPPVYYAIQAAWYFVFGTSVGSARALSAVICGALTFLLFYRLRGSYGTPLALLGSACFLVLPIVQDASWLVMSDLLTGLFVFLAVLSFGDFLKSGSTRDLWWFTGWSVIAILTKGSGWAIGFFMILAPFLSGRVGRLRSPWFWVSGIAVAALAAPFFIYVQIHHIGYPVDPERMASGALRMEGRFEILKVMMLGFLPLYVWCVALLGCISIYWHPGGEKTAGREEAAVALSWLMAQIVFHLLFALTPETRYLMPSAALTMILFTRGLWTVWNGSRRWVPRLGFAAPFILATACFAVCGMPMPERITGYQPVAQSIPFGKDANELLISSDPVGEGAFIAERLVRDRDRQSIILRASKVLSKSTWEAYGYVVLYKTTADVDRYLSGSGVRYILIDDSAFPVRPHQRLLEDAVRADPGKYVLRGMFPIASAGGRRHGDLFVFENMARNKAQSAADTEPQ
jgi:hypothetical protein